jgi:uroporphyrinogen-III synthase
MTRVVVTRPEQDAASWMASLNEAGFDAIEFPLLELTGLLQDKDSASLLEKIQRSQAVMFVSANAVRFMANAFGGSSHWQEPFHTNTRAWCTGPGTAAALMQCGISAGRIDQPTLNAPQLDSEALWQVVAPQVATGFSAIFIRGADETGAISGRDWLVQQLENSGAQVQAVAAYQRQAAHLTSVQKQQVQGLISEGAIWLFSSSASIQALASECPHIDWLQGKAVVTHPRMAVFAEKLGWRQISIAPPGVGSLLASIKSLE